MSKDFNVLDYQIEDNAFIRIFSEEIDEKEFVWHRDENERIIKVIHADVKWCFQFDNQLPFELKSNDILNIKKHMFHRLYKGKGSLVLMIREIKDV